MFEEWGNVFRILVGGTGKKKNSLVLRGVFFSEDVAKSLHGESNAVHCVRSVKHDERFFIRTVQLVSENLKAGWEFCLC